MALFNTAAAAEEARPRFIPRADFAGKRPSLRAGSVQPAAAAWPAATRLQATLDLAAPD